MEKYKVPTVLSIAGFDGSGGAGIQADTKTISALGGYAMNVLTALPVQNTQGVRNIYDIPTQAVKDQLKAIFEDIYPDAIKIGMVHSVELVHCIHTELIHYDGPVVYDPVMVSTSGHQLIQEDTIAACAALLFPRATIITPNLDELGVLVNKNIQTVSEMEVAAAQLIGNGSQAVLAKGGHLASSQLTSLLLQKNKAVQAYQSLRIDTRNTHGSGCTLSSAIATFLAMGDALDAAVPKALDYVYQALLSSKDLRIGEGSGPLNHFHNPKKLHIYELEQ
ncbi:bifunctional hydroxymethylpyrimidine kinase/phosphomethylpyrimidine kinase [Sphingobacterium sp. lm-10]|uniref:bifunctional hydroxymethylpyrimidine kinase/phosphomethylpyrimidine kinase n=1 Tax=Sphingobacterium sp. lm-10 TaxID=2944904 RepID=UPI002020EE91|nr:bifunctional hydroxymethylpyrimidine kinase/phosphomethylpyrimidine kinase [Sphingobacterium sp. lm-10]MCL7986470.1 bifunctional hydroxymethylpyrimidine kinase/phosphomethylpyrimidine kinase [Sphingobacterium sp. lm-10]